MSEDNKIRDTIISVLAGQLVNAWYSELLLLQKPKNEITLDEQEQAFLSVRHNWQLWRKELETADAWIGAAKGNHHIDPNQKAQNATHRAWALVPQPGDPEDHNSAKVEQPDPEEDQ